LTAKIDGNAQDLFSAGHSLTVTVKIMTVLIIIIIIMSLHRRECKQART